MLTPMSPELEKLAESMTGVEMYTYKVYTDKNGYVGIVLAENMRKAMREAEKLPEIYADNDPGYWCELAQ